MDRETYFVNVIVVNLVVCEGSVEMLLGWFMAPISRGKGSCKLNKGRMLPAIMIRLGKILLPDKVYS